VKSGEIRQAGEKRELAITRGCLVGRQNAYRPAVGRAEGANSSYRFLAEVTAERREVADDEIRRGADRERLPITNDANLNAGTSR
jgi:hypothetical protein